MRDIKFKVGHIVMYNEGGHDHYGKIEEIRIDNANVHYLINDDLIRQFNVQCRLVPATPMTED